MAKVVTVLTFGLLFMLIVNGARLTFFPDKTCSMVRGNIMPPLSQSVMEFHREQEKRNAAQ
jgi:hypothetical protein